MKIVHYEANAPWIGRMKCPNPKCGKETPAWQSSGMSDSCPHFFCDTCSNVIHREQDHALLYENEINQELLDRKQLFQIALAGVGLFLVQTQSVRVARPSTCTNGMQ
uniref:Uncharacterized protein n=1 Tax=Salmonella enterica subsp. enterica serovar Albany TaxID=211968 RepID=Q8GKX0_SALET|nr:unknown [Salmonella enterica subsp. enterica serovar Albany]